MPKSDLTGTRHTAAAEREQEGDDHQTKETEKVCVCVRCCHSLYFIDVTRDTSQASMAPCVEPALQFAPVPDVQGPLFEEEQYVQSSDPPLKLPPHAPTHPNSAVCSALRSAGAKIVTSVLVSHWLKSA